ncbi:early activation antigen CD69-like [Neopelma chrysocephalum]|uniref:early activation antigen CD69-like n=1 Tax=Neopelma chrysocephalum TaxID=114329 RepID=UPI000FCD1D48|nr:early activation antigen CD69-like [Neopelma chrysocephalum]
MAQVRDAPCPGQEDASSNWNNGENAEESLSLRDGTETRKTLRKHLGDWFRSHPVCTVLSVLLSVLVLLALVVAVAVLAVGRHGENPVTPKGPQFLACPDDWVGYKRVCYYLSLDWRSWEQAQNRCSELGASLAVLSDREMRFLFRLKDNLDYWLGLRRRGERFQWVDGSRYNSSLEVLGNSECVYLADNVLRSEDCSKQLPYLCSKPQPQL